MVARPLGSRDDPNATGVKGIGAKQGYAAFGRKWLIETVCGNVFHRYPVEWKPGQKAPGIYTGRGESARNAPREIKSGGTKITVTQRRDGLEIPKMSLLRRQLEKIYRPSLERGVVITLHDGINGTRETVIKRDYSNRLAEPVKVKTGVVAGRPFKVKYAALKEQDDVLYGMHLVGVNRVFNSTAARRQGLALDLLYRRVDWWRMKDTFSTNKTRIRFYWLSKKVYELLAEWRNNARKTIRSRRLSLAMSRPN